MSDLCSPFYLANLKLPNNVFYAPLAGCSDLPFRRMVLPFRPGLIFCEMVKMEALLCCDFGAFRLLDYEKDMHPIGAQLVGCNTAYAGEASRIIEDLGFDLIDLNCGCPVDKVTRDGSGSKMLKNPELIGEIIAKIVSAVKIPVSLKIRAGWDDQTINASEITRIAEAAGACLITVHGRTRQQGYKGPANWDYIKDCKQAAQSIKVFGNGDIFDAPDARRMFEHTKCDGVLVARGTLGKPWIVEDICRELKKEEVVPRGIDDFKRAFLRHFSFCLDYYSERKSVVFARKLGCWYFKKDKAARAFRSAIARVKTKEEVYSLLENIFEA